VATRIAPVAPNGCPSAIAPPSGLTRGTIGEEFVDYRETLGGKASFSSIH
jgi:hypothetical protein